MHGCEEKPFFTGKMVGSLFCVKNSNLESIMQDISRSFAVMSKNEKPKGHKWNTYSEFITFIEVLHTPLYFLLIHGTVEL